MTDTVLAGIELVLADLDGVIYRGAEPIPYAVESMNAIPASIRVAYLTNNAARTDVAVAAHLTGLGLRVAPEDVVTSAQAAVRLLAGLVPAGSNVLVVGGDGLTAELEKGGFGFTRSAAELPAAVIQGFAPEVGWVHLAEAAFALQRGIPWVATNTDWTLPLARGTAPGNGTLVSAVHTAVGILPVVAGKPEVAIYDEAMSRYGSRAALMIGDRLDTDIKGANRAGIRSALVLTGIDDAKQVLAAVPDERPTFLLDDLRGLHERYPATAVDGEVTTVGTAAVRLAGNRITRERGEGIDLVRAASSAIWASGKPIYALDVAPELYS
jgi:glycerol 3-phosphatase-2